MDGMAWMFIVFIFCCGAFLVKLFLGYSAQASEWNAKVRQAQAEMDASDAQVQEFVKGKEESLARMHAVEAKMQTLENMKKDLQNKIEDIKRDHSKKGKVIMHRQGPQEG